ncbi:7923_t:CDS:10, partial [Rhizophagus irregularis]
KHEGLYISLFGYLNHLEDCQRCLPVQPPPLRINETVKLMAQNLLQINVYPSHYVNRHLGGKVLIDNERYLLSNQDIINIRNSMTKVLWGIDKQKAEEINIDQLFGPDILATKEQRELAWELGHNKILHLYGTFVISNKKILLFVLLVLDEQNKGIPIGYLLFSAAGGTHKASSSYNHTILKELLLYYKHRLEQEKWYKFTQKKAFRKEIYQFLRNFTENLKNVNDSSYINQITHTITNTEIHLKNQIQNNIPKSKLNVIHSALNFVYYIRDYWAGDLSIGWCAYGRIFAANILGVLPEKIPTTNNHLERVVSIKSITPNILLKRTLKKRLNNQLTERYQNYTFSPTNQIQLEHHYKQIAYFTPDINHKSTQFEPKIYIIQLPKIQCQCMDFLSRGGAYDAIKKVKDHQNKLILSYIKDQCIDEKDFNNNSIQNNTEIQSSCLHTQIHELATSPSTSSPSRVYSSQPEETMLTATNILANLNEMEFITNNIKRLSENIPDGVDDEARNLNKKIKLTLERIIDNEDVRNLKDITNKTNTTGDIIYDWIQNKYNVCQLNKTVKKGTRPKVDVSDDEFVPRPLVVDRLKKILHPNRYHSCYHVICGEHGTGKTTLIRSASGQGVIYVEIPADAEDIENFGIAFGKSLNFAFEERISFMSQLTKKVLGDTHGKDERPKWKRALEAFKRASAVYKAKHNKPSVIIYDNIAKLANVNPKVLDTLQDDAKMNADHREYIAVFVSSEGNVPRRMESHSAKKPIIKIGDLDRNTSMEYLVKKRSIKEGDAKKLYDLVVGRIVELKTVADDFLAGQTFEVVKQSILDEVEKKFQSAQLLPNGPYYEVGRRLISDLLKSNELSFLAFMKYFDKVEELNEVLGNNIFSYHRSVESYIQENANIFNILSSHCKIIEVD